MASQPESQTITIPVLINISRRKSNPIMKLRNISLENQTQNEVEKLFPSQTPKKKI